MGWPTYNTAETKARLNELVGEVEKGRKILIRKRDKVVAMLTQPVSPGQPGELLRSLRQFRALLKKKHGRCSKTLKLLTEIRHEAK